MRAATSINAFFSARAAMWTAVPVITVTREANAPMPRSIRSVWPWVTVDRGVIDSQNIGADLGDDGFHALAYGRHAGDDFGPAVLAEFDADVVPRPESALSTKQPKPMPTRSPAARRDVIPALSWS